MTAWLRRRHPAQLIVFAFAAGILVGTALLVLPAATADGEGASFTTALFTSTSALCVTGLIVVDTPTYWSHFGQVTILGLIQVGGIGIMTLASLLALVVARRLGLRTRLLAQAETAAPELRDVRRLVLGVVLLSLCFEAVAAVVLAARFAVAYDMGLGSAVYRGIFHAVSAFNNAGFALWSDSLVGFATDAWVSVTVALAILAGGLGFPVWLELWRRGASPRTWTLHTKLTVGMTFVLVALGFAAVAAFEWSNAATTGDLDSGGKLLTAFFQGVTPRTAGFNTVDYADVSEETLFVTDVLMFIGAGSASTGGGIKVTTFALLFLMVWSEVRGEPHVSAFGRRVPPHAQRQAISVAFIAAVAVSLGTLVLMAESTHPFREVLFEAVSAFGTVGLSTGITAEWNDLGRVVLVVLMFLGRTGPYTLAVALALRERKRLYRYPEERPIIG
ncbi:MAG TPA: TrkH family potassium uptake protein [Gaiellaceae bacterium]|nr:TrkH family potassium uptake protein [Gaiellaceae bacterium]